MAPRLSFTTLPSFIFICASLSDRIPKIKMPVEMTSVTKFDSGARMAGALQNTPSFVGPSGVFAQCGKYEIHISTAPKNPPSICAVMYDETLSPSKTPAHHKPIVTAGFKCAPLEAATQYTATNTATPQPAHMASQPELLPLVRAKQLLATTESPIKTKSVVPTNSPMNGVMQQSIRTDFTLCECGLLFQAPCF